MRNKFWLGFCVAICLHGFMEDVLGKDLYIDMVNRQWVNTPWWIWPVGLAVILGADWYADHLASRAARMERELELRKFTIKAERRE